MKKIIVFLFFLTIICLNNSKEEIIIPTSSIRYRIIANSDNPKDQLLKLKIKDDINKEIMPVLARANSIAESRDLITKNMSSIENVIKKYTNDYKVEFGNNYFPKKTYRGINYDEGEYESLVITLGNGLGENFWCVLYPPLCLVDEETSSDIEYTTLVSEIIDKL